MESLSETFLKALQRGIEAAGSFLWPLAASPGAGIATGHWAAGSLGSTGHGKILSPWWVPEQWHQPGLPTSELLVNLRKISSCLVKPLPPDLCYLQQNAVLTPSGEYPIYRLGNQAQEVPLLLSSKSNIQIQTNAEQGWLTPKLHGEGMKLLHSHIKK